MYCALDLLGIINLNSFWMQHLKNYIVNTLHLTYTVK